VWGLAPLIWASTERFSFIGSWERVFSSRTTGAMRDGVAGVRGGPAASLVGHRRPSGRRRRLQAVSSPFLETMAIGAGIHKYSIAINQSNAVKKWDTRGNYITSYKILGSLTEACPGYSKKKIAPKHWEVADLHASRRGCPPCAPSKLPCAVRRPPSQPPRPDGGRRRPPRVAPPLRPGGAGRPVAIVGAGDSPNRTPFCSGVCCPIDAQQTPFCSIIVRC